VVGRRCSPAAAGATGEAGRDGLSEKKEGDVGGWSAEEADE
jgi:hypothetical protein